MVIFNYLIFHGKGWTKTKDIERDEPNRTLKGKKKISFSISTNKINSIETPFFFLYPVLHTLTVHVRVCFLFTF